MRILHIYKDYFPVLGGIENHVRDLAELQAAHGHRVSVLVTSQGRKSEFAQFGPNLAVVKAARALHTASTPLSLAMFGLAHAAQVDIVHLHFPYPPGDLAALLVGGMPPLVVTYHSDIVRQKTLLRLYRPLLEHTLHRASRIIATSPAYAASSPWLRQHAAACRVVPLGIDTTRFTPQGPVFRLPPAPHGWPTVLFVGRLRYYKGLHVLLDALPGVPVRLVIAGTGPERERLEAQAAALGLGQQVFFAGDIDDTDLPALYRAADMFVLPAHLRAEALGIAQLEALASGLPCVSTELGTGTSYANANGETGLVVTPGDPAALAGALATLAADPALRQRYGRAARERATALFSQQAMLAGVEQVYREARGE